MATVTVFTAARMQEIEDDAIVGGVINGSGHLILETNDGTFIDAGAVISAAGTPFVGQYTTGGRPSAVGLEGKIYWDITDGNFYKSNDVIWELVAIGGGPGSGDAEDITVADLGLYFVGTNVEAVLQELGGELRTLESGDQVILPLVITDGSVIIDILNSRILYDGNDLEYDGDVRFKDGLEIDGQKSVRGFGIMGSNLFSRGQATEVFGNLEFQPNVGFLHDGSSGANVLPASPNGVGGLQSATNSQLLQISARGHNGTLYTTANQARMLIRAAESVTDASRGAFFTFHTTLIGTSSNREVFRINHDGTFGYFNGGSGVGGTVTQITSKTTSVTLAKATGTIQTFTTSMTAGESISFELTNSLLEANDLLLVNLKSGFTNFEDYTVIGTVTGAGVARIKIKNESGGALAQALVIQFAVIKGAAS